MKFSKAGAFELWAEFVGCGYFVMSGRRPISVWLSQNCKGWKGHKRALSPTPPFQSRYPTIGCTGVPHYAIESSIVCDEKITFPLVLIPYQVVINEHQME